MLAAYRLMGLDIDATYEEIERSFDNLLVQYSGEPKKKIQMNPPDSLDPLDVSFLRVRNSPEF